jgi:hypothetical protein
MPTVNCTAWLMKSYLPSAVCHANRPGVDEGVLPVTMRGGPYPNWYARSSSKRLPLNPAPTLKQVDALKRMLDGMGREE